MQVFTAIFELLRQKDIENEKLQARLTIHDLADGRSKYRD